MHIFYYSYRKYCNRKCALEGKYKENVRKWLEGEITSYHIGESTRRFIKKYLIEKLGNKCQKCGWSEINQTTGKVPIELEHIDGNWKNGNEDNFTLLCPNCHSLTATYKALNKGNGRKRYTTYTSMP